MEPLDKPVILHRLANKMRAQAEETDLPEYRDMMIRAAISLEAEAERFFEMQFRTLMGHPPDDHNMH